jgi:hypothetical protein
LTRQTPLEERRAIFKQTDLAAREIIGSEVDATRKKTAKLKAKRLAKEAHEHTTDLDKKPPAKRT